uniref:Uncharacterized protein n=1 Tax=Klebsiella pneumoniae TaxID=573 RepID=A0A8B0ST93_KLEPN|nr:hypothetical protein [Klebsiella pneumoniae]
MIRLFKFYLPPTGKYFSLWEIFFSGAYWRNIMANIKIAAIADTTQISNTVKSFIDRNPELQDGAVIIKVDVEGCQGRRRTNEIRQFLDEDEVSDQSSVSKVEVQWISTKALNFKKRCSYKIE